MAYMQADTANKVGYRPYLQTNPQGAANLSGYPAPVSPHLGQNHPFKFEAWHLHGLGDYYFNRPFDPWEPYSDVGPGLHGYLGQDGSDPTGEAADELLAAGQITQAEHDAILDGSMSFQDVLGYDPTDQTSWINAVGTLQTWNTALQQLEAQAQAINQQNLTSGTQPSAAFQQFTQQLLSQRNNFESISQTFLTLYRSVTGNVPPGLTGLGIAPVVWVVGAAVAITAVYFGYKAFQTWQASINVSQLQAQTASTAATSNAATNAALTQALAQAQASGDTVTANSILATLQKTAPPSSGAPMSALESWITGNALWLGIGAAALVVLPNLFGGRRR